MPQSTSTSPAAGPHVFYLESTGTVPSGWWWHLLPASDKDARALKGTQGVDFDGPWSTATGAQGEYDETLRLAQASCAE